MESTNNNQITAWNNSRFGTIRSIEVDGYVWFVANDICSCFGYFNTQDAIEKYVDEDDVLKRGITDALGRTRIFTFINEFGLYSLICNSEYESAKKFKRWIRFEILPSVRKQGTNQMQIINSALKNAVEYAQYLQSLGIESSIAQMDAIQLSQELYDVDLSRVEKLLRIHNVDEQYLSVEQLAEILDSKEESIKKTILSLLQDEMEKCKQILFNALR